MIVSLDLQIFELFLITALHIKLRLTIFGPDGTSTWFNEPLKADIMRLNQIILSFLSNSFDNLKVIYNGSLRWDTKTAELLVNITLTIFHTSSDAGTRCLVLAHVSERYAHFCCEDNLFLILLLLL